MQYSDKKLVCQFITSLALITIGAICVWQLVVITDKDKNTEGATGCNGYDSYKVKQVCTSDIYETNQQCHFYNCINGCIIFDRLNGYTCKPLKDKSYDDTIFGLAILLMFCFPFGTIGFVITLDKICVKYIENLDKKSILPTTHDSSSDVELTH